MKFRPMLADIRKLLLWCISLFGLGSIVVFRQLSSSNLGDKAGFVTGHAKPADAGSDIWNLNDHNLGHDQGDAFAYRRLSRSNTDLGGREQFGLPAPSHGDGHILGIVVPFRNRFEELLSFVPYMRSYLDSKRIKHNIFIINQIDKYRFNRASLINIGYTFARNRSCDYMAMHDVDLLPKNKELNYSYPGEDPFHVSGPKLHPKYHYKTFVGGIFLISMTNFVKLDGMSNTFWGWGREDDEFFLRMRDANFTVKRHGDEIKTGYETFYHDHDPVKHSRDYPKKGQKSFRKVPRDKTTGLSTLKYKIASVNRIEVDGSSATIVNVRLHCDLLKTPFCLQ